MKFSSLQKLALSFVLLFVFFSASAQCPVTAFVSPTTLQCGDSVRLTAIAEGCKPLNNNFNSGNIGNDWAGTPGAVVTDGQSGNYTCVVSTSRGNLIAYGWELTLLHQELYEQTITIY